MGRPVLPEEPQEPVLPLDRATLALMRARGFVVKRTADGRIRLVSSNTSERPDTLRGDAPGQVGQQAELTRPGEGKQLVNTGGDDNRNPELVTLSFFVLPGGNRRGDGWPSSARVTYEITWGVGGASSSLKVSGRRGSQLSFSATFVKVEVMREEVRPGQTEANPDPIIAGVFLSYGTRPAATDACGPVWETAFNLAPLDIQEVLLVAYSADFQLLSTLPGEIPGLTVEQVDTAGNVLAAHQPLTQGQRMTVVAGARALRITGAVNPQVVTVIEGLSV